MLATSGILFANSINKQTGEPYLDLGYILIFLVIAAILGDNINYWIGRKIGLRMVRIKFRGKNLVKEEYLTKTHSFYEKYGAKTIIMARFVPIVRTFAPFTAGLAEMNYKKFLSFDVLGGVLWIFSLTLAGYFLGGIPWIKDNIEKVALGIIFISVLPILIEVTKAKMKK